MTTLHHMAQKENVENFKNEFLLAKSILKYPKKKPAIFGL